MMTGSVIIVNGASSAGKSTLCRAAQPTLPKPFLHYGLDLHFFGDVLPRDDEGGLRDWPVLRPKIVLGFYRSLRAFALSGVDVISDYIIEAAAELQRLEQELAGLDVFWVGLHATLEDLERREGERGDRTVGDARRDLETVHTFRSYDLELDAANGVESNVEILIEAWQRRHEAMSYT